MAFCRSAMMMAMLIFGLVESAKAATTHAVGGTAGWTLQPSDNSFYDDQFQNIPLFLGDILFFQFDSISHNVYEVSEADLGTCTATNPIATYLGSNATVELNTTGIHAFICQFPSHCTNGMHLSVTVLASVSPTVSPTPATPPASIPVPSPVTPTPSPSGTPLPAPTPAPTTTTPTPSTSTPPSTTPTVVSGPSSSFAPSPSEPGSDAPASSLAQHVMIVGTFVIACVALLL